MAASFCLLVLFVVLLVNLRSGRSFLSPNSLIAVAVLTYIAVPAIWVGFFRDYSSYYHIFDHAFEKTLIVCLGFYLFSIIGNQVGNCTKPPMIRMDLDSNVAFTAVLLLSLSVFSKLYLIHWGAFFLEDKRGSAGLSDVPPLIQFFNNIHLIGLSLYAVFYFRETSHPREVAYRTPINRFLMLSLVVYSVGIAVIQGRRFGVVYPLLLIIVILVARNRFSRRHALICGLFTSILFVGMTLIRLAQAQSFLENGSANLASVTSILDSEQILDVGDSLVSRVGNPLIIANHAITNRDDRTVGEMHNPFIHLVTGVIPRAVWPSKPSLSVGNEVGKELGLILLSNDLTKINPGWIGESYLTTGLPGIALAGLLFGFIATVVHRAVDFQSDSGICILIQLWVFVISGFQMEMAISFNNLFKGILLTLFLVWLHQRRPQCARYVNRSTPGPGFVTLTQ